MQGDFGSTGHRGSGTFNYQSLLSSYINDTTTHGIRKITNSSHPCSRTFWVCVFLTSLAGCFYHSSYLISSYASSPKVTITEEKDADFVEFPSVTVCNLNVIKKAFAEEYFEMASDSKRPKNSTINRKYCFRSEKELAAKSAVDLSDTWLNLGVTKDNLSRYGHKASELIIQCTYNSNDCSSGRTFKTSMTEVASPLFGLCHTISVRQNMTDEPLIVKKGGTTNGLRLTLNIQKEEYWDLVSSEYGVRILIHPHGTYPTLQRGGIIVSPGKMVHVGIRRRVSSRLPGREQSCTASFENSKVMHKLAEYGLDFDVSNVKYTYEHCNTLCQNSLLFAACGCLDEQPKNTAKSKWKFCNPCNQTENKCRTEFLKYFTDVGNLCDDVCKPACNSTRYEFSMSKSDWPNLVHQQFVINRSREQWDALPQAMGLLELPYDDDHDIVEFVNETFFSENLLRTHLFIEEMLYVSIEERFSYTLPKLMADLGGCLGLYLGVSVVSIIELVELFGSASLVCLCRFKNHSKVRSSQFARGKYGSRRNKRNRTGGRGMASSSSSSNLGRTLSFSKKKNHKNEAEIWRPSLPTFDPYAENGNYSRRSQTIRRF